MGDTVRLRWLNHAKPCCATPEIKPLRYPDRDLAPFPAGAPGEYCLDEAAFFALENVDARLSAEPNETGVPNAEATETVQTFVLAIAPTPWVPARWREFRLRWTGTVGNFRGHPVDHIDRSTGDQSARTHAVRCR